MTTPTNEGFLAGLLAGFGLNTRLKRRIAAGALLAFVGIVAAGVPDAIKRGNAANPAWAEQERATVALGEALEQSAIAQCREAVEFTNRRAKMGFDNVKKTKRGDILVEQPFSVPVFGMVERDNYVARCVLRKNGNFEFGIESDRRRLG